MQKNVILFIGVFVLIACSKNKNIEVSNFSSFMRKNEVVEVDLKQLNKTGLINAPSLIVKDESGKIILSQLIDLDQDGKNDQLIFQSDLPANSTKRFSFKIGGQQEKNPNALSTFCRFVPERMDDFAWENDKVAFRMYGPACQRQFEYGNPAGLISSGIDCWLKKVNYPIIEKWYKKEKQGGSYHQDDGEGLDNFHVGISRGCGATAILSNGKFIYSKNYSDWKIIANGPVRSIFELQFKPVKMDGKSITETKRFTIDLGSNLYKCQVIYSGETQIDTLAIGITLHENKGVTSCKNEEGWISYWEPIDDTEIGLGALVNSGNLLDCVKIENAGKDLNHLWLFADLDNNTCTYYAGFGWKKSGQYSSQQEWVRYLTEQSQRINSPFSLRIR